MRRCRLIWQGYVEHKGDALDSGFNVVELLLVVQTEMARVCGTRG